MAKRGRIMEWLTEFPTMNDESLTALKKAIDGSFRNFTRAYGEAFETALIPVKWFMQNMEHLLVNTPWPITIIVFAAIAWLASRSRNITIGVIVTLLLIGYFGMWEDSMKTVAMTVVATILAIVIGGLSYYLSNYVLCCVFSAMMGVAYALTRTSCNILIK